MTPKSTRVIARAHLSPADSALPSRREAVGHWVGRRGWRGRVARAHRSRGQGGFGGRPPPPAAQPPRPPPAAGIGQRPVTVGGRGRPPRAGGGGGGGGARLHLLRRVPGAARGVRRGSTEGRLQSPRSRTQACTLLRPLAAHPKVGECARVT